MNKKITAAIAATLASGIALAAPASAAVASYSTDFTGVTINTAVDAPRTEWRMFGNYDAEIKDGALRISNAVTSGSFGDQLFSPALPVGAVEGSAVDTFNASFTLKPVALQPGLRVTISPDNGDGGRAGFLAVEHRANGIAIVSAGSYMAADGTFAWKYADVATGLSEKVAHTVQIKLIKKADTAKSNNNDVFSVKVDGKPVKNFTFEEYYNQTDEPQYETDTLLFRVSGTAQPLVGKGLLIDNLSMSVE